MEWNHVRDIVFVLGDIPPGELSEKLSAEHAGKMLICIPGSGEEAEFRYDPAYLSEEVAEWVVEHWTNFAKELTTNLDKPASQTPLLAESERKQLVYGFNPQKGPSYGNCNIHGMFEEQVEKTPLALALETESRSISYSDLNKLANRIADCLKSLHFGTGDRIGIYMSRDVEMVAAMLAVLKVG